MVGNNSVERTVRKPVGRVFFAGEHTCSGVFDGFDIGTVHGAWLTGEVAVKNILKSHELL